MTTPVDTTPTHVDHCRTHQTLAGDCQIGDPVAAAYGCDITRLPLNVHLMRIAAARRDQFADTADSPSQWGDPAIGRDYVAHMRNVSVFPVSDRSIGASCPTHRAWNYVAGEVLDIDVPGTGQAVITQGHSPNVAILTW